MCIFKRSIAYSKIYSKTLILAACTIAAGRNSGYYWKCFFSTEAFDFQVLRVKPAPDYVLHRLALDLAPQAGLGARLGVRLCAILVVVGHRAVIGFILVFFNNQEDISLVLLYRFFRQLIKKSLFQKTITTDCHSQHFSSKSVASNFVRVLLRSHQGSAITFPRRPQTEWKSDVNKRSQSRADSSFTQHNR